MIDDNDTAGDKPSVIPAAAAKAFAKHQRQTAQQAEAEAAAEAEREELARIRATTAAARRAELTRIADVESEDDGIKRNAAGHFLPGQTANAGGHTRAQRRIVRMLEGLSEEAVLKLADLMHSTDERVALEATKEIIRRVAPPPPKPREDTVINVSVADSAAHLAALKARVATRLKPTEVIDVTPEPAAALPAPEGNDRR
jgi:hypothetical protein